MTGPVPEAPETLFRKPGTVAAAQTFMWLQFSLLICCGTGGTFIALVSAGVLDEIGLPDDVLEGLENLVTLAVVVILGVVLGAVLLGVLAAKLGSGRRWAQVVTIVIMLAIVAFGFVGIYSGFQVEELEGAPVDTSDLVWALLWLAMPTITLVCLCTGSANQWFRQRGREPWRRYWAAPPPYWRPPGH